MNPTKLTKLIMGAQMFANTLSKDPSTKVGCLMVSSDGTIVTRGYNGAPQGLQETEERLTNRTLKYQFYEHAERNAIYNKVLPLLKGSLLLTTGPMSMSCLRALLRVGTARVYMAKTDAPGFNSLALEMLKEAKVEVIVDPREDSARAEEVKAAKFLKVLHHQAATLAKDPKATASMFVTPDFIQVTEGYSGFPRNLDDSQVSRYEGRERDVWVETSICNAIYNLARPLLQGATAAVTMPPCVECARALASVGCKAIAFNKPPEEFMDRWAESVTQAKNVLFESSVEVLELPLQPTLPLE